jgi:uncharacterized membrane protein
MTEYGIRLASSCPAGELYAALCRLSEFPQYTPDILSVDVTGGTSRWVVPFRGGLVRWTQRDDRDPARQRIDFEQTDGDFVSLTGQWLVEPAQQGCTFTCRITPRTSVPHLAGAIDPMIARVLLRAVVAVVSATSGSVEVLGDAAALHDPAM